MDLIHDERYGLHRAKSILQSSCERYQHLLASFIQSITDRGRWLQGTSSASRGRLPARPRDRELALHVLSFRTRNFRASCQNLPSSKMLGHLKLRASAQQNICENPPLAGPRGPRCALDGSLQFLSSALRTRTANCDQSDALTRSLAKQEPVLCLVCNEFLQKSLPGPGRIF